MLLTPALVLFSAVAQPLPPWMTGESRAEDLSISLVTLGPGDTVTEWWGHTAPIVEDRRLNHGRLYNFGMFGSDDPVVFLRNFAKGRLEFWAADSSIAATFEWYRQLNRDVRIQELDLTPVQAMTLAKALGTAVLPEHKFYLYHHYNDNCSTRPRDFIDRAIGGQLLAASGGVGRMSIRRHAARYAQVDPVMSVLLDFLQNDELDGPVTVGREAYLPEELERQLQALEVTRPDGAKVPLVKRRWTWFAADRPPVRAVAANWTPRLVAMGMSIAAVVLLLAHLGRGGRRSARIAMGLVTALLGLIAGVPGLVLFLMAVFTDHTVTYHNENLWMVNPLTLAMLPLGLSLAWGAAKARARLRGAWTVLAVGSSLGLLLKISPRFAQDNWNIIGLVLPVNLAMAVAWWLDWRHSRPAPSGGGACASVPPT